MRKIFTLFVAALCCASMFATEDALNGKFTINAQGDQIVFSKGNLRATTADLGEHWTWSFAEHQYDYVGNAASNNAITGNGTVSSNGTVDLFGWSTAATYFGIHNSTDNETYEGDFNFVDWGTNAVSNGGNEANAWRTLTKDEWQYMIDTRTTTSGIRYAKATVNSVAGLILLPDDWNSSYYALSGTNNKTESYTSNEISLTDWTNSLEAHGAVFLPAAGLRDGTDIIWPAYVGHYWSATPNDDDAYYILIASTLINLSMLSDLSRGNSVRLVQTEAIPEPPTAIDQANTNAKAAKRLVNGQLVIEHNGRTYNALGAEVK